MSAARKHAEAATARATGQAPWDEPRPLRTTPPAEPYPTWALPPIVHDAVLEVRDFVQAPMPLVACAALSVLSAACQSLANARRAERLVGPVGVYMLAIAESGERKSTLDGFFSTSLREWEEQKIAECSLQMSNYNAEKDAFEAKRSALLERIKRTVKRNEDTDEIEQELSHLERRRPVRPKMLRILRGDDTPEALGYALANGWPAAAVLSSEAALVLGAHSMASETIARNLGLLNVLWDGGTHHVGRRTSESFTVKNARLTLGLQIQDDALSQFTQKNGNLARGIGFLARFLVAWPETTQGSRLYRDPPATWPALTRFLQSIRLILEEPLRFDEEGHLIFEVLNLDRAAKSAWIDFHDTVERALSDGGDLADIRDVASKISDNAVRIAALFHVLEHGPTGAIGLGVMQAAIAVANWHLNEALRFFGRYSVPREFAAAEALDRWLIGRCRAQTGDRVSVRDIQRAGPVGCRNADALTDALGVLADLDRARLVQDGRSRLVQINPALLA